MKIVMNNGRQTKLFSAAALMTISMLCLVQLSGCGGGSLQEKVEAIDNSFRQGGASFSDLTGFLARLEEFDFENAAFLPSVMDALNQSRIAAEKTNSSLQELQDYEYGGKLAKLGEYVDAYVTTTREALDELEGVYSGLEAMLMAVQPALEAEAAVTQMEAPTSNEEWLGRLYALDTALEPSVSKLREVEVTPPLEGYKAFMLDLLSTLQKMVKDVIPVASGAASNVEMDQNPDFLYVEQLRLEYPQMVEGMYDSLKISDVDPLVEQVELEINRLYLGEADERP
jgi:hypothetical protein